MPVYEDPSAYPISDTIPVVRNLTELNGNGTFTVLPDTSTIAIASPTALPTPNTTAVIIPDFAAGIVTLNIVCVGVAPRARLAWYVKVQLLRLFLNY